ncbi:uncharacterized protein FOMMEDRAFT_148093 [Fomitiporia mediterranea MF3/22]|uniref:uncharacterized protein n=1 Tax=Fomitiporia mediterranea (strain MF3/22) TaxID=694068 RepID=UPI0004407E8D|nr:uncharacterized protein FOMMEDRAFT_148093 [Fomitiporia mediterranea MF3/22]EJD01658.1 hypothetical protein FOMMEDRAFT_148093 [Fomitiporia mediterranea MF3/22]
MVIIIMSYCPHLTPVLPTECLQALTASLIVLLSSVPMPAIPFSKMARPPKLKARILIPRDSQRFISSQANKSQVSSADTHAEEQSQAERTSDPSSSSKTASRPAINTGSAKLFVDAFLEESSFSNSNTSERVARLVKSHTQEANWDGEERIQDAVLRMLVDKYKPLRGPTVKSADEKLKERSPVVQSSPPSPLLLSSTSASAFGQPSFGQSAFGQPSKPVSAFGQPSQTTSAFGQPVPTTSAFGQPAQASTSGFGQTSQPQSSFIKPATGFGSSAGGGFSAFAGGGTSAFGAGAQQPQAPDFGQSAFGGTGTNAAAAPTTSAFGTPSAPSAFGQTSSSAFGRSSQPVSAFGGAGAGTSGFAAAGLPPKPKVGPPDFAAALAAIKVEPGNDKHDGLLPRDYADKLPASVKEAFAAPRFEWGKIPEWVPPVDFR